MSDNVDDDAEAVEIIKNSPEITEAASEPASEPNASAKVKPDRTARTLEMSPDDNRAAETFGKALTGAAKEAGLSTPDVFEELVAALCRGALDFCTDERMGRWFRFALPLAGVAVLGGVMFARARGYFERGGDA